MTDTFYTDKPALGNTIGIDIPAIEQSLGFLNTARGYRAGGLIEKNVPTAGADAAVILPFTPTFMTFDWFYNGALRTYSCKGRGYHDGTDNKCAGVYTETSLKELVLYSPTACIYLIDNAAAVFNAATCAFRVNQFTLTWGKFGLPLGTAYIIYTAFG